MRVRRGQCGPAHTCRATSAIFTYVPGNYLNICNIILCIVIVLNHSDVSAKDHLDQAECPSLPLGHSFSGPSET